MPSVTISQLEYCGLLFWVRILRLKEKGCWMKHFSCICRTLIRRAKRIIYLYLEILATVIRHGYAIFIVYIALSCILPLATLILIPMDDSL